NPTGGTTSTNATNQMIRTQGAPKIPKTFIDGTSKTILFAERYTSCGSEGITAAPGDLSPVLTSNLWGDPAAPFRPSFCADNADRMPRRRYSRALPTPSVEQGGCR